MTAALALVPQPSRQPVTEHPDPTLVREVMASNRARLMATLKAVARITEQMDLNAITKEKAK